MTGNTSKRKGSAFERKVARELGHWLYGDVKALYRSRGSGSFYTRASYTQEVGDISPIKTNLYFPLCVECKNREVGCDPTLLITKGLESPIYKWFSQNERDAATARLFPVLIFKKNFVGEFILFRKLGRLGSDGDSGKFPITVIRLSQTDILYLSALKDFMAHLKGSSFLAYLNKKGFKAYGS